MARAGATVKNTRAASRPKKVPSTPSMPPMSQIQYETLSSMGSPATLNIPEKPPFGITSLKLRGPSVGIWNWKPPGWPGCW